YNIDIAHEFSVLTDRHVKGSDPLSVEFCQILHHLTVADIVDIHLRNENHTAKADFFTEFPGLLGTDLHIGFSRYHDHCRVSCRGGLLSLTHEIKETGSVQDIHLHFIPLNGNHGCTD